MRLRRTVWCGLWCRRLRRRRLVQSADLTASSPTQADQGLGCSLVNVSYAVRQLGQAARDWVSSVHRMTADGRPLLKPSFVPGDLLVVYCVGPGRCTAILQVADETHFDPDLVREEADAEAADRWAWVTPVRALHQVQLRRAPTLEDIGVDRMSVRQKGHISLNLVPPRVPTDRRSEGIGPSRTAGVTIRESRVEPPSCCLAWS
jgi:hypothetical protein